MSAMGRARRVGTAIRMTPLTPALARRGFRLGLGAHRSRVVLLLASVAAGTLFLLRAPRDFFEPSPSKPDVAAIIVKKYAWEAYPQWAVENPSRTCPDRLSDLDAWMGGPVTSDPWGAAYGWTCTSSRLVVWSAGPDATFGTDDDIGTGP